MSGSYLRGRIACPFYCRDGDKRITCEGFDADMRSSLSFQTHEDFRRYVSTYCKSVQGCRGCALYGAIMRTKYDNQDGPG